LPNLPDSTEVSPPVVSGTAVKLALGFSQVERRDYRNWYGRHDGKEAKRMGKRASSYREGEGSGKPEGSASHPPTVKVTLHLTVGTAQRLGVESAMRRISQSAIAEEVLAAYLSRWQLPEVGGAEAKQAG
jgi:hypothetical protein